MGSAGRPILVAAKLAAPLVEGAVLRPDQLAGLRRVEDRRLVYVRAPAGYGKTTLVAAAGDRLGWNTVWYTLDALDRDPAVFVNSMRSAIRRRIPAFGDLLGERLAGLPRTPFPVPEMAALLAAELTEHVHVKLHLILDDYHEAAASTDLNDLLDYLLSNLPASVHIVMASRSAPAFPTAKLKLSSDMSEIGHDLLRFDATQGAAVLKRQGRSDVSREQLELLLNTTEGWAAGVALAASVPAFGSVVEIDSLRPRGDLRHEVFTYLAEEVYRRETPSTQRFLRDTCCLPYFTAELARRATRRDEVAAELEHLVNDTVFTFSDNKRTTYRYHNLFRDFLQDKVVREDGTDALMEELLEAASITEDLAGPGAAIIVLLEAGRPDQAVEVLARHGLRALRDCDSTVLQDCSAQLAQLADLSSWAFLIDAELLFREGEVGDATALLAEAQRCVTEAGDRRGMYIVAGFLSDQAYWQDDFEGAVAHARTALDVATDPDEHDDALECLAFALVAAGRLDAAENAIEEVERDVARQPALRLAIVRALRAQILFERGDYRAAVDATRRVVPDVARQCSRGTQTGLANTLAFYEVAVGDYECARTHLQEARAAVDRYKLAILEPFVSDNEALLLAATGRADDAIETLERCLASFSHELGVQSRTMLLLHLGTALRRAGRNARACETYSAAASIAFAAPPYERLTAQLDMTYTQTLVDAGSGADAEAALSCLRDEAAEAGITFCELKAEFWRSLLALRREVTTEHLEALSTCLREQLRLGHIGFVSQELALEPASLEALLQWEGSHGWRVDLVAALGTHWRAGAILRDALRLSRDLALDVVVAARAVPRPVAVHVVHHALRSRWTDVRVAADALRDELGMEVQTSEGAFPELTDRELEILGMIAEGMRNDEIAGRLVVSVATVKTHVHRILKKLGADSRTQAALVFRERTAE